jgi:MFS family permease
MMESSAPVGRLAPAGPDPRRWWALALLCGAFFMVLLDATIVLVALPSIGADLGFSEQALQWVLSAYALTFGGLLLLGGRAADLLGRRRLFITGSCASRPRRCCAGSPGRRRRCLPPAWSRASAPRS